MAGRGGAGPSAQHNGDGSSRQFTNSSHRGRRRRACAGLSQQASAGRSDSGRSRAARIGGGGEFSPPGGRPQRTVFERPADRRCHQRQAGPSHASRTPLEPSPGTFADQDYCVQGAGARGYRLGSVDCATGPPGAERVGGGSGLPTRVEVGFISPGCRRRSGSRCPGDPLGWRILSASLPHIQCQAEPRVLSIRSGSAAELRVLPQPVMQGALIHNDSLTGILDIALLPELVHIVRHNLARSSNVLRE